MCVLDFLSFTHLFPGCIFYWNRKHKSRKLQLEVLEKKLITVSNESVSDTLFCNKEDQIRRIKTDIETLMKLKTQGAILRTRSNWAIHGEKPTKYFLNLEKQNFHKKTLYKVQDDSGKIHSEPKEVLDQIKKYYQNLYTAVDGENLDYVDKLDIPKITEEQKQLCDAPITQAEVATALLQLKNNKCSSTDGIPPDFYKVFWPKLKEIMFQMYLEVVAEGKLHLSARRGILSLLEKKDKLPTRIKSWRPLTILSGDNKIYSKLLANRLKNVQPHLIHHSQTGFLQGRQLSENIMKICEIMEHCQVKNIDALLISFDFAKAFDTIQWPAIRKAFQVSNFGDNFISMMNIPFQEPLVCASNNGYWSEFFSPTRGCRQGCCFSPLAFMQTVELLGAGIRQNPRIKGIIIGNEEIKAGQYADDLWASLLASPENINEMLSEIESFGDFSGLRLNTEKTNILRIGSFRDSDAEFYTIRKLYWSTGPITILGIKIHPDVTLMMTENFHQLLVKIQDILGSWVHRNLTLIGRIIVVNSLVSTLFIHKMLALPTPDEEFFKRYKKSIMNFIWQGKIPKIRYEDLVQNYANLGLKLVDLKMKNFALKASWPIRWRHRDQKEIAWFFNSLPVKDSRIWICNTDHKDIAKYHRKGNISCALHIWEAWARYHFKPNIIEFEDIMGEMIWGNSLIQIKGQPVFV